ncbi:hypothetical protein [Planctomyces sp. SH-PL62]|uniref:hypothetical protein n=1 Tax=Planctomyces sp. SH-PL62 TaxID=1636152 RepID=UPI00078DF3B9|nr:hypothetical protein [Planctomyces sp. SH-PL62]AMV38351.1 hypothetical protein VT85_13015 [Planctomyces sp. SH-PL62]
MRLLLGFCLGMPAGALLGLGTFLAILYWPRSEPIEFEGGGLQFSFFLIVFGGGFAIVGAAVGGVVGLLLSWIFGGGRGDAGSEWRSAG